MATEQYWRVRCTTDSKYEYVWSENAPTECPTNGAHTIDSVATAALDSRPSKFQTTDATVATAYTEAPTDGEACAVRAVVTARKVGGSQASRYVLEALVRRSGATTTLIGSVSRVVEIEDDAAWHADIDVDGGTDFRVRVTGAAATTIDWLIEVETTELP